MKKLIYYILLLFMCAGVATSCHNSDYDLQNLVPDAYHKVAYVKNYGQHNLSLFTTQSTATDTLIVLKGGSEPNTSATYRMKVLSQDELDSVYSDVQGLNYKLIPQSAFTFESGEDISFAAGEAGKYFPVSFKPMEIFQLIEANPSSRFVLPLQLVSTTDSVNADMCSVLYLLDVRSPMISFAEKQIAEMMIYKSLDVILPMKIQNCDANKWNITCTLDATDNAQAVADYNSFHGTNYELLPANAYTVENLSFAMGALTAEATLKIDRAHLVSDHSYLLPLKIGSSSMGDQMQIDGTYTYVVLSNPRLATREVDRSDWQVTFCNNDNAIGGSEDNAGIGAIFDNNNGTFWHTGWQIPDASSFSHDGVSGDDYDYSHSHNYHAFKGHRNADETVFVIDMGKAHHIIAVGITQRSNFSDFHTGDVMLSADEQFLFRPVADGGNLSDYHQVALNHWQKLLTVDAPHDGEPHWFDAAQTVINAGGVKGRFVKMMVRSSYRDQNVSLVEFRLRELLAIDGVAVE